MPVLYDYLTLVGETNWYAAPAAVISTKNVEPIRTNASGPAAPLTGQEVMAAAIGAPSHTAGEAQPKQTTQSTAKPHATVKKTSSQ